MKTLFHDLPAQTPGTARQVVSWEFGEAATATGPSVYIQAGLHADEWPPMLVAHHLRLELQALEAAGAIIGRIVIMPLVNPIGLSQIVQGHAMGRFDLADGRNFNRGYPDLLPAIEQSIEGRLTDDVAANVTLVRSAMQDALQAQAPRSEVHALKLWLMRQAVGADIVLDLHCDTDAVVHLYSGTPHAEKAVQLASLIGAQAVLTAEQSGEHPFDEAVAAHWWQLAQRHAPQHPIPLACFAATVELRGQADVDHELASGDAHNLIRFLACQGVLRLPPFELPAPMCSATPLEAVEPLVAPHAGVVVYLKQPGDTVKANEPVFEVIDTLTQRSSQVCATYPGLFFARASTRFASAGMKLAKIAGNTPFRTGNLLGD